MSDVTVDEIRKYWNERAKKDMSAKSTTNDVYFRDIETRVISEYIAKLKPNSVADLGCGDGRLLVTIATMHPDIKFYGYDYSDEMLKIALNLIQLKNLENVKLQLHNILNPIPGKFDLVYTVRCLINLPDWELQKKSINNIYESLQQGGYYLMIENFIEGHDTFNNLRKKFNLPEIPVRKHNNYLSQKKLSEFMHDLFLLEFDVNISSLYYVVTRIIYSRLCADIGVEPDYFDPHHKYASLLPFCGEFGPIRFLVYRKK